MKNKITKSIIAIILLCVTVISLVGFCACQKEDDTKRRLDVPQYDSFLAYPRRIYINEGSVNWDHKYKIEIVTAMSEFEKFNILGTSYSEEFFEHYVVMLIQFKSASSDHNIEFKNLALKDGKFYPIVETYSPIANEGGTTDIIYNIYMVEVSRKILEYEFADILVINRRDVNMGSCYHESITTVFE